MRVNAISPGFFPAEQNRALLFKDDGSYTERGGQIIGHTPMARFGEAQELAGAVVWLASVAGVVVRHGPEHRRRRRLFVDDDLESLQEGTEDFTGGNRGNGGQR